MGVCLGYDSDMLLKEELRQRVNLSEVQLVDYTARVKRYSDMRNNGKISVDQLQLSFKDTELFKHLKNPASVVNKLILSPFFTEFSLTHNDAVEADTCKNEVVTTKEDVVNQSIRSSKPSPKFNCEDIVDQETFQTTELKEVADVGQTWISVDALLLLGLLQCSGTNLEKAKCFYMIVQPSFDAYITYQDKDLQRALHFLISLSTVLEEMTQDMETSATL